MVKVEQTEASSITISAVGEAVCGSVLVCIKIEMNVKFLLCLGDQQPAIVHESFGIYSSKPYCTVTLFTGNVLH